MNDDPSDRRLYWMERMAGLTGLTRPAPARRASPASRGNVAMRDPIIVGSVLLIAGLIATAFALGGTALALRVSLMTAVGVGFGYLLGLLAR